ncbi:kinase-like protein [Cadophora sp. DSE1049]|nr:kinase-like protein [Cadophora sp. DSE1049]
MSLSHDLHDFRLETSFETNPRCVVHTIHKSDPELGIRKVVVQERWVTRKPELGFGLFGPIRLEERLVPAQSYKRTQRAVKVLHKQQMKRRNFDYKKELLALAKFSRSKFVLYFVEFQGWFEDDNRIYLAMEYLPLGTLKTFITDDLKEPDAKMISMQLLEGLKIIHEEGFAHRDLKPENIFVVQSAPRWWVKIGDFGISKRISNHDTALHTATGTPSYWAPEVVHFVIEGHDDTDEYTNAVDIWSLGCLIYEMLALKVPFPNYPRGLSAFCRGGPFPEAPLASRASAEGIEFLKSVLIPRPTLRPSATEILTRKWLQFSASEHGRMVRSQYSELDCSSPVLTINLFGLESIMAPETEDKAYTARTAHEEARAFGRLVWAQDSIAFVSASENEVGPNRAIPVSTDLSGYGDGQSEWSMGYLDSDPSSSREDKFEMWNTDTPVPFDSAGRPTSVRDSSPPFSGDETYLSNISVVLQRQEKNSEHQQCLAKLREIRKSLSVLKKMQSHDSPETRALEARLEVLERQFLESVSENFSVDPHIDMISPPGETNLQLMSRLMIEQDIALHLKRPGELRS